ncbi:MAG: site-specific DNA-methyltransferase, partial [Deltaproteobacteria bacterium]|nr:site-specific DNA-methyltransferase [Deltaproteobacteria bacterium]
MGAVHDTILNHVRSGDFVWNRPRTGHDGKYVAQKYRYADGDGRRYRLSDATAAGLSGGGYEYEWNGHVKVWRYPIERMREIEAEGRLEYT